jgi:hypothetical protein
MPMENRRPGEAPGHVQQITSIPTIATMGISWVDAIRLDRDGNEPARCSVSLARRK